ncbi:TPA: hypothetical protein HA281_00630 [Candidatus Woesearchaeota archaeon]|nr:hypothetical protein [Candidatus Woesearchaeota archaeon]
MGFMKFLSKGKKPSVDELDVPPLPPDSGDLGAMGGEFPAPFPGDDASSELSGFAPYPGGLQDTPAFDDLGIPELQDKLPRPEQRVPAFLQRSASQPAMPPMQPMAEHHTHLKAIYIHVTDYKQMTADMAQIRSDLRRASLGLTEMLHSSADREKDYNRYRNALMDMQKKLVFVDKTLFRKGETQ